MKLAIQIGLIVMALVVIPMLWMERVQPVGFTTQARPAWSRKYKADCSLCHTTYPRLNRTGYEFRRLGYRFKWEVDAAKAGKGSRKRVRHATERFIKTTFGAQPTWSLRSNAPL